MIHRGVQYSRAIRTYYKKFGRYPTKLEDLDNTNNMRYLRKHYKDPMNCKNGKSRTSSCCITASRGNAERRLQHWRRKHSGRERGRFPAGQSGFGGNSSSFGRFRLWRFGYRAVRGSAILGLAAPESIVPACFRSRQDRGNSNGGFGAKLNSQTGIESAGDGSTGSGQRRNEFRFGIGFLCRAPQGQGDANARRPAARRRRPDRRRGQPLQERHDSRIQPQEEI